MLNGELSMKGSEKMEVAFTNNTLTGRQSAADTVGGQAKLFSSGQSYYDPDTKTYIQGNKETIVHEDWICEAVRELELSSVVRSKKFLKEANMLQVRASQDGECADCPCRKTENIPDACQLLSLDQCCELLLSFYEGRSTSLVPVGDARRRCIRWERSS